MWWSMVVEHASVIVFYANKKYGDDQAGNSPFAILGDFTWTDPATV